MRTRLVFGIVMIFILSVLASCGGSTQFKGEKWKELTANAPFEARRDYQLIAFKDKLWLLGGSGIDDEDIKTDIWSSKDGEKWTKAGDEFPGGGGSSVVFDDKLWFIRVSYVNETVQNELWNSVDGVNWSKVDIKENFPPRLGTKLIVFNEKMWLFGGWSDGKYWYDIWCSSDGINWEMAASDTKVGTSCDYGIEVFGDKLLIIAGQNGFNRNNVWSSSDGVNWTMETSSSKITPRHNIHTAVLDDKVWVIGGFSGSLFLNDTWFSEDGANWDKLDTGESFPGRDEFAAESFKNRLWVIGGITNHTDSGQLLNDIWYME